MSTNPEALLDELQILERTCREQRNRGDYAGLVGTVRRAAAVDHRLRHLVTTLTALRGRSERFEAFRNRDLTVLELVDEFGVEGWEDVDPSDDSRTGLPDAHLRKVIDFEEATDDWAGAIQRRLFEAAFLVSSSELPEWVLRHFRIARRCFALEMYDATWVFLRGTIEAVSFEWLARHGHLPAGNRVRAVAEWRLQECLRLVRERGSVPSSLMNRISRIVLLANAIVHRKREVVAPTEAATLRAIRDVVAYAERLFR